MFIVVAGPTDGLKKIILRHPPSNRKKGLELVFGLHKSVGYPKKLVIRMMFA
jgi:hypothetical protein